MNDKTAREMFEEQGYMMVTKKGTHYLHQEYGISIIFYEESKRLAITDSTSAGDTVTVDMEIYHAITQQMKELGWLK